MAPLCAIPPCLISACLQPSGYPSCSASGNAGSVRTREYTCALRKGLSLSCLLASIIRKASAQGALARLDAKNLAASLLPFCQKRQIRQKTPEYYSESL